MVKTGHVEASINFLDALERAKVIHPAASAKARAATDVTGTGVAADWEKA